ncbi:alpha/beta fold hydrolase [Acinetobacter sp. B10A]|uniref:alpha/beta hydrolase n=1 Tax=Acinetobacter baretiae TaxID=2605383 RepID=UPI001B3C55AD|nr:alpha/beta fold hydrolase [Acinetobacter baretiae]MBF7684426.1 alpha/beta fold hydrolase [Acinetobacter baretiae]
MIDFSKFIESLKKHDFFVEHSTNILEHYLDELYLRIYKPILDIEEIIIVYHGGGVNSDAGYDILAKQLIQYEQTCVCLVDIRGHGRSCRNEKNLSSKQIWQDVDIVVQYFNHSFPQARIHLLGHSSGGGMLLNYLTRYIPTVKIDSLILLAPEFGPFTPTNLHISSSTPFASVNKWIFIINAFSFGFVFGNHVGVKLNFPQEVIQLKPDFVQYYSVNVANALTPHQPLQQLKKIVLPVAILIAENDELFDADQMLAFAKLAKNTNLTSKIIKSSTHLDCIFNASEAIQTFIKNK